MSCDCAILSQFITRLCWSTRDPAVHGYAVHKQLYCSTYGYAVHKRMCCSHAAVLFNLRLCCSTYNCAVQHTTVLFSTRLCCSAHKCAVYRGYAVQHATVMVTCGCAVQYTAVLCNIRLCCAHAAVLFNTRLCCSPYDCAVTSVILLLTGVPSCSPRDCMYCLPWTCADKFALILNHATTLYIVRFCCSICACMCCSTCCFVVQRAILQENYITRTRH